jgi:hypothetical protein
MTSIASSPVTIQTSPQSVPSTPSWFGEMTVIAHYLRHQGVLSGISERVRFARRRFGHYDLTDFAVVLLGYAVSGERTLEEYYERLQPFANVFMAFFGRDRLPARSTLSRFLAALEQAPLEDLIARLWRRRRRQEGCGIGREPDGRCSMSMARDKLPVNGPCPAHLISHRHTADWTRSVRLATRGASGERLSGPGPRCFRLIRTNGLAHALGHLGQATATIAENCGRP